MDELENDALSILMILDETLLPQFLEWSASQGWSDLILFLMETDFLRFRNENESHYKEKRKHQISLISRLSEFHLTGIQKLRSFNQFVQEERTNCFQRLSIAGIPFYAIFSLVCEHVWKEVLERGRLITSSPMWPSIRRSILIDTSDDVNNVLNDVAKRKYFERYLQSEPSNLASLHCYLSLIIILNQVEQLHSMNTKELETPLPNGKDSINKKKPWWRYSSKAATFTAIRNANQTMMAGSGSILSTNATVSQNGNVPASTNHSNVSVGSTHSFMYSDPFEAFSILLEGARSLQKQYFPTTSTATLDVYGVAMAGVNYPMNYTNNFDGTSYSFVNTSHCAGLSESLRLEIAATLSLNSSVRTADIEQVDQAFAFTCANALERLLVKLKYEMMDYIQSMYKVFESSNDYIYMIANLKGQKNVNVQRYYQKSEFLHDRVRRERYVHWLDPSSHGKSYICYNNTDDYHSELPSEPSRDTGMSEKTLEELREQTVANKMGGQITYLWNERHREVHSDEDDGQGHSIDESNPDDQLSTHQDVMNRNVILATKTQSDSNLWQRFDLPSGEHPGLLQSNKKKKSNLFTGWFGRKNKKKNPNESGTQLSNRRDGLDQNLLSSIGSASLPNSPLKGLRGMINLPPHVDVKDNYQPSDGLMMGTMVPLDKKRKDANKSKGNQLIALSLKFEIPCGCSLSVKNLSMIDTQMAIWAGNLSSNESDTNRMLHPSAVMSTSSASNDSNEHMFNHPKANQLVNSSYDGQRSEGLFRPPSISIEQSDPSQMASTNKTMSDNPQSPYFRSPRADRHSNHFINSQAFHHRSFVSTGSQMSIHSYLSNTVASSLDSNDLTEIIALGGIGIDLDEIVSFNPASPSISAPHSNQIINTIRSPRFTRNHGIHAAMDQNKISPRHQTHMKSSLSTGFEADILTLSSTSANISYLDTITEEAPTGTATSEAIMAGESNEPDNPTSTMELSEVNLAEANRVPVLDEKGTMQTDYHPEKLDEPSMNFHSPPVNKVESNDMSSTEDNKIKPKSEDAVYYLAYIDMGGSSVEPRKKETTNTNVLARSLNTALLHINADNKSVKSNLSQPEQKIVVTVIKLLSSLQSRQEFADKFSLPFEESCTFMTNSEGLFNISKMLLNQSSASSRKESQKRHSTSRRRSLNRNDVNYYQRFQNVYPEDSNGTGWFALYPDSYLFNVSMIIKSVLIIDPVHQHTYQHKRNPLVNTSSHQVQAKYRVHIGLAFAPVLSQSCLLTLLKSVANKAFLYSKLLNIVINSYQRNALNVITEPSKDESEFNHRQLHFRNMKVLTIPRQQCPFLIDNTPMKDQMSTTLHAIHHSISGSPPSITHSEQLKANEIHAQSLSLSETLYDIYGSKISGVSMFKDTNEWKKKKSMDERDHIEGFSQEHVHRLNGNSAHVNFTNQGGLSRPESGKEGTKGVDIEDFSHRDPPLLKESAPYGMFSSTSGAVPFPSLDNEMDTELKSSNPMGHSRRNSHNLNSITGSNLELHPIYSMSDDSGMHVMSTVSSLHFDSDERHDPNQSHHAPLPARLHSQDSFHDQHDHEQDRMLQAIQSSPVIKYYGICDFPICEVIHRLSTRLTVQILLLILTEHPVVFISSSTSLLTKFQQILPRLLYPFRIQQSYRMVQILTNEALELFSSQSGVIPTPTVETPHSTVKVSRSHSFNVSVAGVMSHSNHPTRDKSPNSSFRMKFRSEKHNKMNQNNQLEESDDGEDSYEFKSIRSFKSSSFRSVNPKKDESTRKSSFHIPSVTEKPSELPVHTEKKEITKDEKTVILAIYSDVYYNARPEVREKIHDLMFQKSFPMKNEENKQEDSLIKNCVVFDLDANCVMNLSSSAAGRTDYLPPSSQGNRIPSHNQHMTRLGDEYLMKSANFEAIRELIDHINDITAAYHDNLSRLDALWTQNNPSIPLEKLKQMKWNYIIKSNLDLETSFLMFWSEILLKILPQNIYHYPQAKVVACDVKSMIIELLTLRKHNHHHHHPDQQSQLGEKNPINSVLNEDMNVFEPYFQSIDNAQNEFNNYVSTQLSSSLSRLPPLSSTRTEWNHVPERNPTELKMIIDNIYDQLMIHFMDHYHETNNILYVFYKEFLMDYNSRIFLDLIVRHAHIVDHWSF